MGASTPDAGVIVIDQNVHTPPTRLRRCRDQDVASTSETGISRRRSKLAWAIAIVTLVLGATLVFESTPPEQGSQAPAKPTAAPMPVTATEASTSDRSEERRVGKECRDSRA